MKLFKFLVIFFLPFATFAAETSEMNKANNPLTPMLGFNLQDYVTTSFFNNNEDANTFLARGIVPHKTGGLPQIARLTVPYASVPDRGDDYINGLGDVNFFDIFLMEPKNGIEYGFGPYFVFPTATQVETGADKWQAGVSAVVIKPGSWGMLGGLVTYQHSFAGPSERPTQNLATVQPFLIYNLAQSYYVRSSAVMNFNWQNGDYYVPVGAGLGKVWKLQSGNILNAFIEPQWTVAHGGENQPEFQIFMGLNMQLPFGQ